MNWYFIFYLASIADNLNATLKAVSVVAIVASAILVVAVAFGKDTGSMGV